MRKLVARVVAVIRIEAAWLAIEPLDMRAGTDSALARVVQVFGGAHPHHAYLFANRRANRIKVLVHDGIGIWLAASYHKFTGSQSSCGPCQYRHHCLRHPQRTGVRQVALFAKNQASPHDALDRMKRAIDTPRGQQLYSQRV